MSWYLGMVRRRPCKQRYLKIIVQTELNKSYHLSNSYITKHIHLVSCHVYHLFYVILFWNKKNFWTSIFLYWGLYGCLLLNTLNNNMHGNYLFCVILVYHIDFPFDVAWRHQAIAWINADLSSVRSSDNYLNVILQEIPRLLITKNSLPITYPKWPNKSRASVRNYGTAT